MHCSDTAEICFDNVRVPMGNIIGEEGRGFHYQMGQFQNERLVAAAVGWLERGVPIFANFK
jgi:alkylation response protein AidB-like acyl-CoA dehydrogenase